MDCALIIVEYCLLQLCFISSAVVGASDNVFLCQFKCLKDSFSGNTFEASGEVTSRGHESTEDIFHLFTVCQMLKHLVRSGLVHFQEAPHLATPNNRRSLFDRTLCNYNIYAIIYQALSTGTVRQ